MKKFLIIIASILMLPTLGHGVESADEDKIRIALTQTKGRLTRSAAQIPVECYYRSASNEIILGFTEDLGTAEIRIQNLLSGETAQDSVKTSAGIFSTILFGASGYYTIDISCEDGSHFHGEFQTGYYDDGDFE